LFKNWASVNKKLLGFREAGGTLLKDSIGDRCRMKHVNALLGLLLLNTVITVGCRVTRGPQTGVLASSAEAIKVPSADHYDFMGCRKDAGACDADCTQKAGLTLEAVEICPKGGFDGHLACFCEKESVR